MDELLPDELRVIRDSVNRFMETEVNPVMDEIERQLGHMYRHPKKPGDVRATPSH